MSLNINGKNKLFKKKKKTKKTEHYYGEESIWNLEV